MLRSTLLLLLLTTGSAAAADAYYETYAAGLPVAGMDAQFEIGSDRYRVMVDFHTTGALNLLFRSRQRSQAVGRFTGAGPSPARFTSTGTLRGEPRLTEIEYVDGQPQVRQLVPPNKDEREPVPPDRQRDTIDSLSALAGLLHRIEQTGRCEGEAVTYDGRRLATLRARTAGTQVLDASGRSSFAGQALRCEFVGRQIGGFMLESDRDELARPQTGTAWFATVNGALLPVRIAFHTRWIGDATMYLAQRPR